MHVGVYVGKLTHLTHTRTDTRPTQSSNANYLNRFSAICVNFIVKIRT